MHRSTYETRAAPVPTPVNRSRITAMADSLGQSMDLMGATMAYRRNSEIFSENEPAEYLYKVISGSVRTYKILHDGRRQIGGFYLPGDIFGLEFADEHTMSAEAIDDTKVLVVKRTALNALAGRDASIARPRIAPRSGSHPAAYQERTRAGRRLPFGNGGTGLWEQHHRAADVTPGYCRLSRSDY
jgi:hypothetical protein